MMVVSESPKESSSLDLIPQFMMMMMILLVVVVFSFLSYGIEREEMMMIVSTTHTVVCKLCVYVFVCHRQKRGDDFQG